MNEKIKKLLKEMEMKIKKLLKEMEMGPELDALCLMAYGPAISAYKAQNGDIFFECQDGDDRCPVAPRHSMRASGNMARALEWMAREGFSPRLAFFQPTKLWICDIGGRKESGQFCQIVSANAREVEHSVARATALLALYDNTNGVKRALERMEVL
jgi:hypothetical protein